MIGVITVVGFLVITQLEITNSLFTKPRKVWVQPAVSGRAADCCIFLDAELYIQRVKAPEIIHGLQSTNALPPTASIYLSNCDSAARHTELTCNEAFSSFLATDLCRWIAQTVDRYERLFLCGLSLSGLAAAFTAMKYPAAFAGVLCQSPSAWWNDESLTATLSQGEKSRSRYWISVGNQELDENVSHPPSGLYQKANQLDSVRRLARKLNGLCKDVRYAEFAGGHDPACWADELPGALGWLTESSDAAPQ